MGKNLTALLQKGDIRPKDRVLLLVSNFASEEINGKSILTEADKHALSSGWRPKNNDEVKEYNTYNEAWRNAVFAEMDAQTTYLNATIGFLRACRVIDFLMLKTKSDKTKELKDNVAEQFETYLETKLNRDEALNNVLDCIGFELDYLIYAYAFELASEELRKDLLALYPDAKTETDYLDEEQILAEMIDGKKEISKGDKEKLAELITDKAYNKLTKEWYFYGHFASFPILEAVKQWADYNKIPYKETSKELTKELNTKLTAYAEKHKKGVREILKETIIKLLDEGLFIEAYTPIFNSDNTNTCNEQETKQPHKKVFKEWLKVKAEATATIQGLIDKSELEIETKEKRFSFYNVKKIKEINLQGDWLKKITLITGKSLYNLKGEYSFVKDFKQQAESFRVLGLIVLFLKECSFIKDYEELLAFEELLKRLSITFETDLTYKVKKWIEQFKKEYDLLNHSLVMMTEDISNANYRTDRVYYLTDNFFEKLITTPLEKTKPDLNGRIKTYFKKIKEILGDAFNA